MVRENSSVKLVVVFVLLHQILVSIYDPFELVGLWSEYK